MFPSTTLAATVATLLSSVAAQQFVMYTPGGDDTAVERIDPVLAPGTISQHVHQVFGSNALSSSLTYDSLQSGTTCTTMADASNNGNAQDNSVYWHPALFMQASNGTGYIRVPTNGHKVYYQNAGSPNDVKRSPFEFPHGFRMIAGNALQRAAATNLQSQNITQWECHDTSGTNQGTAGGFPTGVTNCASYDSFNGAIHFPHCWNGNDFNISDPTAHMSYPTGDVSEGVCPSTHPTRLPHIFMENTFNLPAVVNVVKPNTFVLAQGDNTGYGWHADFFNGWVDGAIPALFSSCPQGSYGNEDIGTCTSFVKRTTPADQCKLPTTYVENVTNPGQALPGCNPIVDTNPAPVQPIAPIGVATTVCSNYATATTSTSSTTVSKTTTTTSKTTASSANTTSKTTTTASTTLKSSTSSTTTAKSSTSATTAKSSTTTAKSSTTTAKSSTTTTKASTTSTTTTGSVSTATPTCPASNGVTYKDPSGATFLIECSTDHVAGDMGSVTAHSLAACISSCATTSGCVDVSLSGSACYLKSTLGASEVNSGVNGAKLLTAASKKKARKTKKVRRDGHGHAGVHAAEFMQ